MLQLSQPLIDIQYNCIIDQWSSVNVSDRITAGLELIVLSP